MASGGGVHLFKENSGGFPRDFWIGHPLFMESEMGFFNQSPAFWSCADKMMTLLLERADFLEEDHGIRPHSLKVTTISSLMGEIIQGRANLAQLAVQRNYRALTAQDMGGSIREI